MHHVDVVLQSADLFLLGGYDLVKIRDLIVARLVLLLDVVKESCFLIV